MKFKVNNIQTNLHKVMLIKNITLNVKTKLEICLNLLQSVKKKASSHSTQKRLSFKKNPKVVRF